MKGPIIIPLAGSIFSPMKTKQFYGVMKSHFSLSFHTSTLLPCDTRSYRYTPPWSNWHAYPWNSWQTAEVKTYSYPGDLRERPKHAVHWYRLPFPVCGQAHSGLRQFLFHCSNLPPH